MSIPRVLSSCLKCQGTVAMTMPIPWYLSVTLLFLWC
jgi:hypothetical protein